MLNLDMLSMGMDLYRKQIADRSQGEGPLCDRLGSTPSRVIHQSNKMRVLAYDSLDEGLRSPAYREPVILVPSLINRAYILDLLPKFSLTRFLLEQGFRVYLVDWGVPSDEDRFIEFDSLIEPLLDRAVQAVLRDSGERQAALVGYCMGATLAAIYSARHPQSVAAFVNLLGPIDFAKCGMLQQWTEAPRFDPAELTEAFGNVPSALMQTAFQGMRPTAQLAKQIKAPPSSVDVDTLEFYDALEYWAWDNIPFPGTAYTKYIRDLYQQNRLVKGELRIHGKTVSLQDISCPILVLTADKDHIVPVAAAQSLQELVGSKDTMTITVRGGHVAGVVGPTARTQLWPEMSGWLKRRLEPIPAPGRI